MRRRAALLGAALVLGVLALSASWFAPPGKSPGAPAQAQAQAVTHTVTWDKYSLMVDSKRVYVWGGEFHYFRQPSPGLWRDTLEKIKAAGFNAVSLYFEWQYHSPKQGVYDFTGVRDVDQLLQIADDLGMYVLARPGPYINGELDAGGMADWVLNDLPLRTTNPCTANCPGYGSYLSQALDYTRRVDQIIARHQVTNGGGNVIAYQLENEASPAGSGVPAYMSALAAQVRADGITVPFFTNEAGARAGSWVPGASVPWNDWYGFNDYPVGLSCTNPTSWNAGQDYETVVRNTFGSLTQPIVAAEFQGGAIASWGSAGFDNCRQLVNGQMERVYHQSAIASQVTVFSMYMFFGGTSWGWQPSGYTSYDYGAPITESRQLPDKYLAAKQIGYMVQSLDPLTKTDSVPAIGQTDTTAVNVSPAASTGCTNGPTGAALTNCGAIYVTHRANPDSGAQFYFLRHNDRRSTVDSTFNVPITTPDGSYTVPQAGTVELNGRDMKTMVANYALNAQHLVYSTSNVMTHAALGDRDIALLWAPAGQAGETVLRYTSQPTVDVLAGTVTPTWDAAKGDLRLNYVHNGLAEVRISGGGIAKPLLLLLADDDTSKQFWTQWSGGARVLERGPALVRGVTVSGTRVDLTGDTKSATTLTTWAPAGVTSMTWNGAPVSVTANPDGRLSGAIGGAPTVTLPALTGWRYQRETPEARTTFDDSSWTAANHTDTNNTVKPVAGQPVLYADDYGFHKGDVWYRGHFTPTTDVTTITLGAQPGSYGLVEVWLNGTFLGSRVPTNANNASNDYPVPAGTTVQGADNVIAVLVRTMNRTNAGAPRGLTAATLAGSTAPIAWKLQGNQGGEDITDTVRGTENNGGLYGERAGWSLAGYPDTGWSPVALPDSNPNAGVTWYRTTFDLNVPAGTDASLGLNIDDVATKAYRASIFVNGWNLGHYINNVGPQHTFVLHTGILKPNGKNTVAIAVINHDATSGGLGKVSLVDMGTVASSLVVPDVTSPAYDAPKLALTAALPATAAVGQTIGGAIATLTVPPDALGTALDATIDWGDGSTSPGVLSGGSISGTHTYTAPYTYPVKVTVSDHYGAAVLATATRMVSVPATANGTVGGSVPATLALTLGPPAQFAAFTPGIDRDYTASTTANVISTAGDATLSVSDPGHLTNGAFALPEALRVEFSKATWAGPVANEAVTIAFKQHIGATDALRTGAYSRTLTFTLSTTTP